ncbi:LOW QUALITY PROTEIN: OCIA domain-containing protein 2 [Channa argus]|uniref:LOW QUALITY PROTEIN: OCIA domain-containing protein 2 n=1 Tax=Channa argus TaxID=215402 RepID=UPI0035212A1F
MSSETTAETVTVKKEAAVLEGWKCPLSDPHLHRDDLREVWKECQEEGFWYRALPLSLGSIAVTSGLIYTGIWKSSKRLGPFPKLAVAGILGYAVGKASYVGTCQRKFQNSGLDVGLSFGPWSVGHHCQAFNNCGPGHRCCNHVCEECKKTAQAAPVEQEKS